MKTSRIQQIKSKRLLKKCKIYGNYLIQGYNYNLMFYKAYKNKLNKK